MTELPPPILVENGSYENWRNELQMWQITTTMEPKRQALAVRAKLTGKVREAALKLDAADLNNDSGMSFLIDALDATFRKQKKWDVPNSSANQNNINGQKPTKWDVQNSTANQNNKDNGQKPPGGDASMSAAERAKQRGAQLSSKLAAEGKYQTQPLSLLPKSLPEQFSINKPLTSAMPVAHQVPPEVKKMDNGNSFAEFNINDVCARPFLTRSSSRDLIAQQSGASLNLRGRFLTQEDKRQQIITGVIEKPLVLNIQANVAAKVQVAIHKIMEVCRNYEKFGAENNFNNYGLSNNINSTHHFVQDKLFVGLESAHPDFNLREKLAGENGTNFTFMVQQTGAKVFLRGRGSNYLEPNSRRESFEALHIYISHPHQDGLDMARQLCESLIETVKTQYQQWTTQRMAMSTKPPLQPPYGISKELRYPIFLQNNGYNTATYTTIPPLMSKAVTPPDHQPGNHPDTTQPHKMSIPPVVVDYRLSYSNAPPTTNPTRPCFSQPTGSVNEYRSSESNYNADDTFSGKEKIQYHTGGCSTAPNEHQRFQETDNREKKSDRSSRRRNRSRSQSPRSESPTNRSERNKSRSRSPESKKSSRFRESNSGKTKVSLWGSPNRKASPPAPRESPRGRRDSSPDRLDSPSIRRNSSSNRRDSPLRRDSPPNRRDLSPRFRGSSPSRRDATSVLPPVLYCTVPEHVRPESPPRREASPVRKVEQKKRKFTEEPKKKRKFSEDPRLLEKAKVVSLREESPEEVERSTIGYLQVKSLTQPKLQFRSKKMKEETQTPTKPKSILKMAPPPMLPMVPKKVNGLSKSVKISPAGLSTNAKKRATFKDDTFMLPPPVEKLKPPSPPQKALKMGALSSLSMYEGDSDEDD